MGSLLKKSCETCEFEFITPEKAQEYYKKSTGNRKIRKSAVDAYARDIKNGKWQVNGESIVFNEDGVLIDGHHRLLAIMFSKESIRCLVVRGISRDVNIYDRGIARTTQDNFKFAGMDGWKCQTEILATVRRCLGYIHPGNKSVTDSEINEYIESNADTFEFLSHIVNISVHGAKVIHRKSSILSAMAFAHMCGVPEDVLRNFANVLATGFYENHSERIIIVLRNAIISGKFANISSHNYEFMRVTEFAIYNFYHGNERKQLRERGYYSEKIKENIKKGDNQ